MTLLPHLAARLFGVPLAIHRPKLDLILAVLGPRVGWADLAAPAGLMPSTRAERPAVRPAVSQTSQVALIPIHGTLVRRTVGLEAASGLTSYAELSAQLEAALASPEVAAILLDIDSPGGESAGVFDLADRIRAASRMKPVWAVANDMALSAAYALASAASKVFVSRTGGVGSIGVIAMHADQSKQDAQNGLHYTAVFAGARKNDLNPHAPISSEAQAYLQAEVDRIYGLFVETVARHRGLDAAAVRQTEAGLFFGQDALACGLADAVGTVDEALAQLLEAVSDRTPVFSRPSSAHPTPGLKPSGTALSASGSSPLPQLELSMNDRTDPTAPDRLAADPAGHLAQPAPAAALNPTPTTASTISVADAVAIAQTCTLAGRTELIAGFLEAQASPTQVRHQLLAAQAQASPEISSLIRPDASTHAAPYATSAAGSTAVIDAVKRLVARAPNTPQEA